MKKNLILIVIFAVLFSFTSVSIVYADQVKDLCDDLVKKLQLQSGKITVVISEQPDSTGFINKVYFKAENVSSKNQELKNVRIDSFIASVNSLQLNAPSEWKDEAGDWDVECNTFTSASAVLTLTESEINKALANETYDHVDWIKGSCIEHFIMHDMSVDITAERIKLSGLVKDASSSSTTRAYIAAWLLGTATSDYPIEINSKLKISEDGKKLLFDNPEVKVEHAGIKSYVEKKINSHERVILDLNELTDSAGNPLITLSSVALSNGSVSLSTTELPTAPADGITYTYGDSGNSEEINLPAAVIEPVNSSSISPNVLKQIAKTISPDLEANDLKFITSEQIGTAVNPTKSIYEAIKKDSHEAVYKMNQLEVQEDGWYIFMVNVPKEYQGQSADNFKIYLADKNVFPTAAAQTASLVFGLLNAVEIDSLGLSLKTMPAKFLAVAFLQASTPFSVFLGKLLLALLTGCEVGLGAGVIALLAFALFKRN